MANSQNLRRGFARERTGSFSDIRPALAYAPRVIDGVIQASWDHPTGAFQVITANRFGERKAHRNLTKPDATAMVASLRSRGYPARYEPMSFGF